MLCSKQPKGIEAFSNLPLRFRPDNSGVDRAAKPIGIWKPVCRLSGGGLLTVLIAHRLCDRALVRARFKLGRRPDPSG